MLDFTTLAKAMDLKRKGPDSDIAEQKGFLDNMEVKYDELVLSGFGSGSDMLLESILIQDSMLDIEEMQIPITTIEMLDRGE